MSDVLIVAVPAIIWIFNRVSMENAPTDFDFDTAHATFYLLLGHYLGLARFMVVVDLVAALVGKHYQVGGDAIWFCLAGAAYGFLFSVWLVLVYERYLHVRYSRSGALGISNYTVTRRSCTNALGFSAIIFSVAGVAMVAMGRV